jgi:hypothetical protein
MNCSAIVRWRYRGSRLSIDMQAVDIPALDNGRYTALGFSEDSKMGNDTVVECVFDAQGTGATYVSYNENTNNIQFLDATQKMIKKSSAVLKDGKMVCNVEIDFDALEKVAADEQAVTADVRNGSWTLLFAQGMADPSTGEKFIHTMAPWISEEQVSLCERCPSKFHIVHNAQDARARR